MTSTPQAAQPVAVPSTPQAAQRIYSNSELRAAGRALAQQKINAALPGINRRVRRKLAKLAAKRAWRNRDKQAVREAKLGPR